MSDSEQLLALFRRCTARILGRQSSDEQGTGFFVAPGLLLTCAHVVKSSWDRADSVVVEWEGRSYTASIKQYRDERYSDLALLKIEQKTGVLHP
jgi:S1-C subfamily serine protease